MTTAKTSLDKRRWHKPIIKFLAAAMAAWLLLVALPSLTNVRAWLIAPLYVHDPNAFGQLAYVMADGDAYFERLRAASDLFHTHKIQSIYILEEQASSGYNYSTQHNETKCELAIRYLGFFSVPRHAIHTVAEPQPPWLSSLSEAQALSRELPGEVDRVVVVTSAPHTRRSLLCFQRSLPSGVSASAYAASPPLGSAEIFSPIWKEYCKLAVYFLLA